MRAINQKAPVTCSNSIAINAGIEKVWRILTDINNWSDWQVDISHPKLNGELKTGSTFTWKTGGAKIHSTLHTLEPHQQLGWTGKTFGVYAIHNWKLEISNGQTIVFAEESMEGFLATLFKKAFTKNLEKGMQHWLDLLKIECEK